MTSIPVYMIFVEMFAFYLLWDTKPNKGNKAQCHMGFIYFRVNNSQKVICQSGSHLEIP